MSNPYQSPTAEIDAKAKAPAAGHPSRDWMIWLTTAAILLLCLASGLAGIGLVLAWGGAQLPGPLAKLSGSSLLEPLGAGGLSLTAIALAFAYGQLKAVFEYDLVWTRTVASALLIASAALVIGSVLLMGRVSLALALILPAAGMLLLGLCMLQWHRKLRFARLRSPRPIVPAPQTDDL